MKKYSMLVVFAAFLSLAFNATAFAWGDKAKKAEHETKANYYGAKSDVKDALDDAGDEVDDFADDAKDSIKDATN